MLTFGNLIACLKVEELNITTLAVMLNLCNDYGTSTLSNTCCSLTRLDPAQEEAAKHRLDSTLSDYLVREKIPEAALDYATDLLAWTTEKLTSAQLKDDTSLKVFDDVLEVIETCDEDHYTDFLAIIALYLQDTEFQLKLATPERLEKLVDLVLENENRLGPEEIEQVFRGLSASSDPEKLALDDTSVVLLVQLINSVGAISASDAFVNNFGSRTPAVKKIKSKLLSPKYSPSTVCACVMLGNLATSDKACIEMVEDQGLHLTLISLLSSSKEPALLYAAAGYMRHLTFPEANRTVLGESGLIETCCQLLVQKDPSVRGEAAAMLCKLVTNNFYNIEKVVYESIPDDVPATSLEGVQTPAHTTILYHVVSQSLVPSEPLPSTTMKNPMIELGRTIIAILRYLGRPNAEVDVESVARHMFKTPLVARPVARLVRQRFYADARSEGVLGLGLLAQSPEGAAAVIEEVKADEGLLAAIKEFAVEQDKDGQRAGRDCQNALVFLHGLTANGVSLATYVYRHD